MRIENNEMILEVAEKAAEITSFKEKATGVEVMWQGDPKFWTGRNPTLFPMVGSTYNKKIVIDGKTYEMGNHGFCRHSMFTCTNQTEDSITMTLEANEETLAQYPFKFRIDITYKLEGKKVAVTYVIKNEDEKDMPFNFGLHPAFNCPQLEGEKFEDYWLEFSNNETLKGVNCTYNMNDEKKIPLTYPLFEEQKTIIFEWPKSSCVSLTNGKRGVHVYFSGYRWIAFWTIKPGAPYVCIEPWHSHTDFEEVNVPFEEREGTKILSPGKSFTTEYQFEYFAE